MIVNRGGDGFARIGFHVGIEFLDSGVQAAHDALQLGELFDQFGRQIGLRQQRRFMDDPGANRDTALANVLAHPTAYPLYPQHLVVVAAQVFLEGDVLQPRRPLAQGMLLVSLPEEAGVVKTRTQHALMPMPDDAGRIAVRVQHRQKMWREAASGSLRPQNTFDGRA